MIALLGFILMFALYTFNVVDAQTTILVLEIITIVEIVILSIAFTIKTFNIIKNRFFRCVRLYKMILDMLSIYDEYENNGVVDMAVLVRDDIYDMCITLINKLSKIKIKNLNQPQYLDVLNMYNFCSKLIESIESEDEEDEQDNSKGIN